MKNSAKVMLVALLATSSMSFAMTMNSISQDQVKQAFVNKTFTSIATAQLNGQSVENSFTGYMDDKGNTWGKFAHKPTDAAQTDQGTYVIKDNGLLCPTWQHWMGGKQFCVDVYETNNSYVLISDTNVFHTVFMKNAMHTGKQL